MIFVIELFTRNAFCIWQYICVYFRQHIELWLLYLANQFPFFRYLHLSTPPHFPSLWVQIWSHPSLLTIQFIFLRLLRLMAIAADQSTALRAFPRLFLFLFWGFWSKCTICDIFGRQPLPIQPLSSELSVSNSSPDSTLKQGRLAWSNQLAWKPNSLQSQDLFAFFGLNPKPVWATDDCPMKEPTALFGLRLEEFLFFIGSQKLKALCWLNLLLSSCWTAREL